jgi:hypothetical protein
MHVAGGVASYPAHGGEGSPRNPSPTDASAAEWAFLAPGLTLDGRSGPGLPFPRRGPSCGTRCAASGTAAARRGPVCPGHDHPNRSAIGVAMRLQAPAGRCGPDLARRLADPAAARPTRATARRRRTPSTPAAASARGPMRRSPGLAGRCPKRRTRCPRSRWGRCPESARPRRRRRWRQTRPPSRPASPPSRSGHGRSVTVRSRPPRSSPRAPDRANPAPPPPPAGPSVLFRASLEFRQPSSLRAQTFLQRLLSTRRGPIVTRNPTRLRPHS